MQGLIAFHGWRVLSRRRHRRQVGKGDESCLAAATALRGPGAALALLACSARALPSVIGSTYRGGCIVGRAIVDDDDSSSSPSPRPALASALRGRSSARL
jgi:hypothetical protein